jgi:hypothetical protein
VDSRSICPALNQQSTHIGIVGCRSLATDVFDGHNLSRSIVDGLVNRSKTAT